MLETFPVLHTERLDLVEIRQEHLEDIFKIFGDSRVTEYYNIVTLKEVEEAQKFVDHFRNRFAERAGVRWGIALKGQSNIIGTIGFNNFAKGHRANIGYDLQQQHWGRGYLTEALKAVAAFGFKELGINRIEAEVMPGNVASERVLDKVGFAFEGVLRDWMLWNAKHYDMRMYSLLRERL